MSESPRDPGLTPGDPLGPGPESPRHESGLPAPPPAPAPSLPRSEPAPGYSSPPPPGAFGAAFAAAPGPVAGRYTLAGWWSRVGATLLDGVILLVGAFLILLLFGSVFSVGFFADDQTGVVALIVGLFFAVIAITIVSLLYAPLMMSRTNGKTLGRMAVGIRVVRANGEPMTFGWALLREVVIKGLLFGIAGSVTFGLASLADVLWPLWDDENRALHDFLVDTRTVVD
jgi:uncharacterized RDD family membrane protein YckC